MCFTLRRNKQVKAGTEKRDFLFSLPSVMPLAAQELQKENLWEKSKETRHQPQVQKWQSGMKHDFRVPETLK